MGAKIVFKCGFEKYHLIEIAYNFLIHLLKSNETVIDGHKMFLDKYDSLNLTINGIYEPLTTEFVKKEIKKGNVVVDIGANIGYYTLIFAKLVGEEGKVFAFEPDPTNFSLLKKNVETNGYKNVVLIQKAVLDKTGKGKLYLNKYDMGAHTVYDTQNSYQSIDIETIRLDDYFDNYYGKIDFIKIDIEGGEGKAILGMLNLLKKNDNVKLITEFNPFKLRRFGTKPEDYLKLLIEIGFELYEINEREKKIKQVNICELIRKYPSQKGNYTNLLCTKEK